DEFDSLTAAQVRRDDRGRDRIRRGRRKKAAPARIARRRIGPAQWRTRKNAARNHGPWRAIVRRTAQGHSETRESRRPAIARAGFSTESLRHCDSHGGWV